MSDVQRYDPIEYYDQGGSGLGQMRGDDDGDYVLHEDYERDTVTQYRCAWTRGNHRDRFGYDHDTQCGVSCAKKTGGDFCQFCGGRVEVEVKDE